MKLNVTVTTEATVTKEEIGHAIFQFIIKSHFDEDFDDAGCDWYTNKDCTKVFIDNPDWCVSENPDIAKMVHTAQMLIYGQALKMEEGQHENT